MGSILSTVLGFAHVGANANISIILSQGNTVFLNLSRGWRLPKRGISLFWWSFFQPFAPIFLKLPPVFEAFCRAVFES